MRREAKAVADFFWDRTSEAMTREYGKVNLTRLGREAKIGGSGVTRIKKRNNVTLETVEKVAKAFGREPWQMLLPHVQTADEFVLTIPRYRNAAGMGKGVALLESDSVVERITVTKPWVQAHVPSGTKPQNLRIITAYGDSMEPTLNNGDFVLVDTALDSLDRDGVYVLMEPVKGELFVKRVSRTDKGPFVTSDNPKAPPFGSPEGLKVVGKVVYAWNGRTL